MAYTTNCGGGSPVGDGRIFEMAGVAARCADSSGIAIRPQSIIRPRPSRIIGLNSTRLANDVNERGLTVIDDI